MDHATGVAGLVFSDPPSTLEHAEARTRMSFKQLAGDGQADYSAADHGEVALRGWRISLEIDDWDWPIVAEPSHGRVR
jgi:hypothetical protein